MAGDNCGPIYAGNIDRRLMRGGTGFGPSYRDVATPSSNQVGHFWEYVDVAFVSGYGMGTFGNTAHEGIERLQGQQGASWEDWHLGNAGAGLGDALRTGLMKPSEVPAYIGRFLTR